MCTENFHMYKLDLEKLQKPEIKLPTFIELEKKEEKSRRTSTFASLTTLKPLTMWITTNYGKFFKRWKYQTTLPASCETCMQVKKQQLEPNNRLVQSWEKEGIKAVYCHPAYLTSMHRASCEMPGCMTDKL